MALVILLDQRDSKNQPDLVGDWQERLNDGFGAKLTLPFVRTAGDEMQAVVGHPDALGEITREVVDSQAWWLGIGVGAVESPRPADTREGRGSAFWSAREAIGKAKGQRGSRPIAVVGADDSREIARSLDDCLGALAYIVAMRTDAQRKVADAWRDSDRSAQKVAEKLNISVQGARQRIVAAGCEEEAGLTRLAGDIGKGAAASWT